MMAPPIFRRGTAARKRRNAEKVRTLRQKNPLALALKQQLAGGADLVKTGKFNAKSGWVDGHFFPSNAEGIRYLQLKELQELGTIAELELQPPFPFHVNGHLVGSYRADFRYRILPGQLGTRVLIEEVKGVSTDLYRLKKKLVHALYPGVEIIELKVPRTGGMERFRFLTADQIGVPEKGDRQRHVKMGA